MKKDQYIPHEVSMRNTTEVMKLIEKEGMAGYGIYWALMEYLRTQDNYVGDVRVLKSLARQLKTKIGKITSVLTDYGLFVVTDFTFRSAKLEAMMKPLEDKRKAMSKKKASKQEAERKQSESKVETERKQAVCNPLEINNDSSLSKVKESKVKERKETTTTISSSSVEAVEVALPVSFVPAWERYVNELQDDEQWKELVAMRSGLKEKFSTLFPRIVEAFKRHVRSIGNEGQILSPGDAKHYFWFFMNPSSPTYKNLILELQKPMDRGKYKYEDYDSATGQRSYCGVPIPADAPPRPNNQAVWCEGEWVY